jgi:hypothetical protein
MKNPENPSEVQLSVTALTKICQYRATRAVSPNQLKRKLDNAQMKTIKKMWSPLSSFNMSM